MEDRPRVTPYDVVFANQRFEQDAFPNITAEAEGRGVDVADPDAFVLLGTVGALLRELPAPEAAPDRAEGPTPVELLRPLAALLFQAFHFWRCGRRVFRLDAAQLDQALGPGLEVGTWTLEPPHSAGYLQLPRHRLWSRIEEGATAEAVDGFFWAMIPRSEPPRPAYQRLDVLLALGMHPGRPGLSVIECAVTLPAEPPGHWADLIAREHGEDFANVLPGGELTGLRALVNTAEVLKLVSRVFWNLSREAQPSDLPRNG